MATKGLRYGNKLVSLGGKGIRPGGPILDGLVFWVDPAHKQSINETHIQLSSLVGTGRVLVNAENGPVFTNNNHFTYDGVNDRFYWTGVGDFSLSTDMSVSIWFKPVNHNQGRQGLVARSNALHEFNVTLETSTRISFYFSVDPSAGFAGNYYNGASFQTFGTVDDEWQQATFTRDLSQDDGVKIYRNGSFTAAGGSVGGAQPISTLGSIPVDSSKIFKIGDGNGGYFEGAIGQVLVYDRALTSTEVLDNYNAEKYRYPN